MREDPLDHRLLQDLSAEFYLETVQLIFQDYALPRGHLRYRGRRIDPAAIRRTALLTGRRTRRHPRHQPEMAAQDLATGLRPNLRTHYLRPGVGHYGMFSGKRWQNSIYPVVRDVIHLSQ